MRLVFAETLRSLREEKGYSQQQLAEKIYIDRTTVSKWEAGVRLPDIKMITRIAHALDMDVNTFLNAAQESEESPNIILVDDEKILLSGGIPILESVFPGAVITGFLKSSDALAFAKTNPVFLAFLDIEMGRFSGLDLCRELLGINPRTNVIFLTGYRDYALDAWDTGAKGFLLKPLTAESVRAQL
jgi:transcriptional regulator with XRE-family HTH domain